MTDNLSHLLTHPFEIGILPYPKNSARILICNTEYWNGASDIGNIDVVHDFYPQNIIWENQGVNTAPNIKDNVKYDVVLCALPKQKEASFYHLAQSLNALHDDGLLIAMAANDAGGKRLEKWFKEFGLSPVSVSKAKCRIVWAYKSDLNNEVIEKFIVNGAQQIKSIEGQDIVTQPGIFGWDKIDKGSKLLTKYISSDLSGIGADFGCGYGFLSNSILNKCPKIKKIYAIDADNNALSCAKENLKTFDNIEYQWADLTKDVGLNNSLNFIIMNPPFHAGKKADSDIGQKFIETAASCLKKNGTLYMVANAYLPYEKLLSISFDKIEKLAEEDGFKIYKAIK